MTTTKRTEPLRLLRRGGTWSVEYTRLVAVDEHILRPEQRRVAASREALRSLAKGCPPERIQEALVLMGEDDDGSERTFELADDGWAESLRSRPSELPCSRGELGALLADTKAQLVVLRGLYDALLTRVVHLESEKARPLRSMPPRVARRVPSRKSVFDALCSDPVPPDQAAFRAGTAPTTTNPTSLGPSPNARAAAVAPVSAAPASREPALDPGETQLSPTGPSLSMPGGTELVACLQMLAAGVPVTQVRTPPPAELSTHYVALISEESSNEALAALLFDKRAAAEFGGGIFGATPAERDREATEGLSADSLDGLNEVANNLTGLINRANPKRPVRLGALEFAAHALPAWLTKPAKKLGFSTREDGCLFLLAR
jgi:hypothetical protein